MLVKTDPENEINRFLIDSSFLSSLSLAFHTYICSDTSETDVCTSVAEDIRIQLVILMKSKSGEGDYNWILINHLSIVCFVV